MKPIGTIHLLYRPAEKEVSHKVQMKNFPIALRLLKPMYS
jgi:hypothetical protein